MTLQNLNIHEQRLFEYRNNPVLFAQEMATFRPDNNQQQIMLDLAEHNMVTVKSGHGVGKTALLANIILWFLTMFYESKILATAPAFSQLNDALWSEVAKWLNKSDFLPHILTYKKTYVEMKGSEDTWFATARTAKEVESMQGVHADNMLIIADEASGVDDKIMEALLGTLTGRNNKIILCANPTRPSGFFFDTFNADRALWRTHTINAEKSEQTNKASQNMMRRKYGADSDVYRVRVLGEFPKEEANAFIPLYMLERSVGADYPTITKNIAGTEIETMDVQTIDIGCDVARYGDAKTVISYKVNEKVGFHQKIHGQDVTRTANEVIYCGEALIKRYDFKGGVAVKVDDGGVGGGVVDILNNRKKSDPKRFEWLHVIPVNFGKPLRKNRYYHDTTTYMMATLRDLLSTKDDNGNDKPVEIVLPNDNDLIAQLSVRRYFINSKSKIQVESKDDMQKRNIASPDEADSVLLLVMPTNVKKLSQRHNQSKGA